MIALSTMFLKNMHSFYFYALLSSQQYLYIAHDNIRIKVYIESITKTNTSIN